MYFGTSWRVLKLVTLECLLWKKIDMLTAYAFGKVSCVTVEIYSKHRMW